MMKYFLPFITSGGMILSGTTTSGEFSWVGLFCGIGLAVAIFPFSYEAGKAMDQFG